MPHKITYLEDEGGLITTYWGDVSDGEIIKSGEEKLAILEKLMKTCRYALTDLSLVKALNLTSHGIRVNADISLRILKEKKDILIAFVVPDDFGFGMSRMWQAYADHSNVKSRIFRTRSEAETWIQDNLEPSGLAQK